MFENINFEGRYGPLQLNSISITMATVHYTDIMLSDRQGSVIFK